MHSWPFLEAKARFSEFLQDCQRQGPQMVARRGRVVAVLVAPQELRDLQTNSRPSLKQLLLSDQARSNFVIPGRDLAKRRKAVPML